MQKLILNVLVLWGCIATGGVAAAQPDTPIRPAWKTSQVRGTPEPPSPYLVEPAFPKLTFSSPLDLTAAPGSRRLFVAEQGGRILSFLPSADAGEASEVLNLKSVHETVTAVYAVTFHPDFANNRLFYVCYIEGGNRDDGSCVAEFRMQSMDPPVADPASERQLIRWWSGGHNGCSLQFGPDGMLYISTGDGGAPSPPDPLQAGQDCSNLLSCILRIDVAAAADGRPYQIPADNPFVQLADVRPEIWAFGFRNPWRMSFDRATGDLWVGDVGWQLWEMIHRVERGGNYGWPIMEGPQTAVPGTRQGPAAISPPVVSHPHSEAASMTGGFVYRGSRLPELRGAYIYGDYQTGRVWGLRFENDRVTWHEELAQTPLQLVSFGEDSEGELYLVDYQRSQQIWQLTRREQTEAQSEFPQLLSETGIFQETAAQIPSAGVRAYQIVNPQWQDGAQSERWMALPGTEPLTRQGSRWEYPDGAVLAKTLSIETTPGDPSSLQRLETQLLHREDGVWRPYSYRWNDDQTDARLTGKDGDSMLLQINDPQAAGGSRQLEWRFAARAECQVCHNPWVELSTAGLGIQSASPLGTSPEQLAVISKAADGMQQSQLETLQQDGWLAGVGEVRATAQLAALHAEEFSTEQRVRSWLHVNCSHCHQPHAGGSALIDLRRETKTDAMQLVGQVPLRGAFGISGAGLVVPGDPEGSVLLYRIASCAGGRMPRLGATLPDPAALSEVRRWIAELPRTGATETVNSDEELDRVRKAIARLETLSAVERAELLQGLVATARGALMVLLEIQDSEELLPLGREIALLTVDSQSLAARDLFARFLPPDRARSEGAGSMDRQSLLAAVGDVDRGRAVFRREGGASCINCHRAEGVGVVLGPALDGIGRKMTRAEILNQIEEPSGTIKPTYLLWSVETTRGLVHTGLLKERTTEKLVLANTGPRQQEIPVAEIESVNVQQKSLMPEQLLRELSSQDAADLLEYLESLVETGSE